MAPCKPNPEPTAQEMAFEKTLPACQARTNEAKMTKGDVSGSEEREREWVSE